MYTPVRDADWSVEYSVGLIPVGDIRIDYLRDTVDRGQSTDAAPLSELLVFYTLLHLYNYCAAGSALSWTFCDTVWKNLSVEELSLRCSVFPVYQMMEGAALVDNRSGVTFDAELCIPWDAPRAVVNETSTEAFTSVSLPHGVVLFSRDGDVDHRRILLDGDGRVVQFRRPEVRSVNKESCDVRAVVMKEAEELRTSEGTEDTSADSGNSITVAGIHGPRGGDTGGQLGAGLFTGLPGTCVEKGERAAVDCMAAAVSTSVNDYTAGRWCRTSGRQQGRGCWGSDGGTPFSYSASNRLGRRPTLIEETIVG